MPWQRLRDLRAAHAQPADPDAAARLQRRGLHQLSRQRGAEVRAQAAETGVDVFRVFDSLNWVENMRVAMDAVLETGKICEGTICYTGDISTRPRQVRPEVLRRHGQGAGGRGRPCAGLKDMAGLLKPEAARVLVPALKEEVGLPIHFHTHDTAGIASPRSWRPPKRASMRWTARWTRCRATPPRPRWARGRGAANTDRDTGLDIAAIREISDYWEAVRGQYAAFESGMQAPASEVYLHEMPGGQFTNLKAQARSMGLEDRWHEVARPMPM
jgi:pyruvate carboxylase